jgi:AcrR family transcriptional regulator
VLIREPRQPRSEETRRRILEEAEALFARDGYAGASLGTLATEVGIHKPGIFYYFKSKRALYEATVALAVRDLEKRLSDVLTSERPPRERLVAATATWVDSLAARPALAQLLLHEVASPDSASFPSIFREVGERILSLMTDTIREIHPHASADDLFHHYSLVTGGTLFYASAMNRFTRSGEAGSPDHSMEHHKKLLVWATRDYLKRLGSRSADAASGST